MYSLLTSFLPTSQNIMKSLLATLLILNLFTLAVAEDKPNTLSPADQAKAAQKILTQWQETAPEPGERFLHIVCWTPNDRELPADYENRLTRIMLHIQDFYAREMQRNGLGYLSFNLQMTDQKKVVLHTVKGKHPTSHYGKPSGNEIRNECHETLVKAGIDPKQETVVIFCNLADWDAEKLRFTHKSPYYARGTNRGGTAWQLDSAELDIPNISLKEPMIHDGEYGRISLGKHNSIFIGGIAHELGHALGLPHNREKNENRVRGRALMGSGNRTYGDELRNEGPGSF